MSPAGEGSRSHRKTVGTPGLFERPRRWRSAGLPRSKVRMPLEPFLAVFRSPMGLNQLQPFVFARLPASRPPESL